MYFSGGAMAGLLSALIAYINRTVSFDGRERPGLRRILLTLALAAVIGSGAAFVTGMYLVGDASAEKTSSHLKGAKEKSPGSSARQVNRARRKAAASRTCLGAK